MTPSPTEAPAGPNRPGMRLLAAGALAVVALACWPQRAAADDATLRYVSPQGDDRGACTLPVRPCRTVQYALSVAGKSDQVRVAGGTYEVPDVDDAAYLAHGSVDVRGGYDRFDHFLDQAPTRNPTTLIGVPLELADRLRAQGFDVIVDQKGLDAVQREAFGAMSTSASGIACANGRAGAYECDAVDLLSHVALGDMAAWPVREAKDIWGFVDLNTGREYALIGLSNGLSVFDVTDPRDPLNVGHVSGAKSRWRDVKVLQRFDHAAARWRIHAYVSTESPGRLAVVDLTGLPNRIRLASQRWESGIHNVHVSNVEPATGVAVDADALPLLYTVGGHDNRGGFLTFDLGNPGRPSEIARSSGGYSHDAASMLVTDARASACTAAGPCPVLVDFNENTVDWWDLSVRTQPRMLASRSYPGAAYVHSGWPTEDGRHLFVHDEKDELRGTSPRTTVRVFSLTSLTEPTLAGSWSGSTGAIDHNGYVRGNRYYMSTYTDGLTVLDITDPVEPVQVGHFDTYPTNDRAVWTGAWGVYPFLPSGNLLVSDISGGLYVLADRTRTSTHGRLGFTTAAFGGEEGNAVSVAVRRGGGTAGAVSVGYAVIPASADATDAAVSSGTLEWPAGEGGERTISVSLTDDGVAEDVEFVLVRLVSPRGGAVLGEASIAKVFVSDAGGATTVGFAESTLAVAESTGFAVATVQRMGSATGAVSVRYAVHAGTATADADYLVPQGSELSWADGDATPRTIVVPVVRDDVAEGPERFELRLSGSSGADVAAGTLVVTVNDDAAGIELSDRALALEEGGPASYTVRLSARPKGAVEVISWWSGDSPMSMRQRTSDALSATTCRLVSRGGTVVCKFGAADWHLPRTIELKPGEDDDRDDETGTLLHSVASVDGLAPRVALPVTVVDGSDGQRVGGLEVAAGVERLALSWQAVTDAHGYRVQWKSGDEAYNETDRAALVDGGSTASYVIADLVAGQSYAVRVSARFAGAEDGEPSVERRGIPHRAAAEQVTGLTVTAAVRALSVSWTALADADGYKVQWKSGSRQYNETDRQRTLAAPLTAYRIEQLVPGRPYTVRVRATRALAIGDGAPSDERDGTPVAHKPMLTSLALSGIDIAFAPRKTSYATAVGSGVVRATVRATPEPTAAAIVSPADADGEAPGHQVDLAVGMNEIVVTVTAADGTTTRTYTVAVTRAVPPPVATLAGAGAVAEGAPAVFEATLDRAPAAALTVAVAVSGSAGVLAGTPPASVAFAAGETRATLTVATAADRVIEADGTVTATLSAGEGYTLGADTVADVTVTDDDVAAWAVTASLAAIEEGGGATLTVSTGNGTTFPAEVAIALGVSGTVSEADYALSASSLTLAVGTGTVTATLSATEDDETEEAETATVTASVDGAAVGSTTLTVEDAAPAPTIAGVPQVGGVLEAVPSSAVGYQWLRAGEPIAGAVAERYAPVAADVDAALSVRVDARGRWRTSAPTMPIWAAPVSPPLAAGEEELLGTTMTLGRGAAVYQLAGFLRRGDWERWPEDFGSVDDASFADGRHELRAFLVNEPGTFGVATAPDMGDATDVTAYWNEHALGALEVQETSGATVWVAPAAPNSERYFHTAPEASEGVRVAVSLRRPLPEATLTASSETVAEGASATFAVDLDRAAWSALEVAVAVTEAGTMLSGSVPATVTFAAGESTATLTLATDDDAVVEGDGALTVALAPGDGYVVGTAASAGTAVTDNDAAEFDVSAAPDGIDEGGAATLTVSIGNGVTFAVDQAIALSVSGTAVSDDYRLSATSLVLGAGTSSVSATLTALRDVWAEPAETVTVTATRAGSAVGAATVTIAANEAVVSTVTVTAVATPVTEGAAAQFELRLDAAALAALTVAVSASETGSVLSGTAPATVAFAVGESSGTISLATDDDTVVEADGAVTLTLLSGSGYVAGAAAAAVVTVADNDSATFDVSASSGEIDEGEETTVTVSIGNGVTFAAEQRIVLSVSGTATAADYLLAPSALTLAAGASSVEATLTAVDDTDEELAETVTVTATRAGSAVGAVTVTIRTSDVPSDDATLASLTLSGVDIGSFAADVTDYTAAVETEVASTTVTATAHDAGAAVVVADGSGSTAGDTRTVSLAEGDNAITATVTAEDGTTTRTYRVTVTRAFARTWGERLADRDIALGPGAFPSGLWSDGSTLWVIENWSRGQVRAYALADGSRRVERDIVLRGGSGFPSGLWSDGSTLWVADHNGGVTAHLLSDGSRLSAEDLDGSVLASAGNLSPTGLWSDGSTLWVADHAAAKVFAYRLSDKTRLVGREFALVDGNGTPMAPFGVWSDGELVLASNYLLGGVLGYGLADGVLRAARTLDTSASGTANPLGVWSDGRVLWVVDDLARRVYAYAVPGLGRARVSGVFPIRSSNRAFGVPSASAAGAAVRIPDGGLRRRIAAALGKLASAPIGERELAALEWLDARGAGVADLTGLQYAVNLTAVDLGANALADLRVLAELPSLTVLNLDGTTADVWPLARLTGLRRLSLRGGGLTDVQALGGLTALRVLDIGDNHLEDLAPLGGLSALEALRADGTAVEDTSALDGLERLHVLDLGDGRPQERSR